MSPQFRFIALVLQIEMSIQENDLTVCIPWAHKISRAAHLGSSRGGRWSQERERGSPGRSNKARKTGQYAHMIASMSA